MRLLICGAASLPGLRANPAGVGVLVPDVLAGGRQPHADRVLRHVLPAPLVVRVGPDPAPEERPRQCGFAERLALLEPPFDGAPLPALHRQADAQAFAHGPSADIRAERLGDVGAGRADGLLPVRPAAALRARVEVGTAAERTDARSDHGVLPSSADVGAGAGFSASQASNASKSSSGRRPVAA